MPAFVAVATWPFGRTAVEAAAARLRAGDEPVDAAAAGAQAVEDDPTCRSVGFGGLPNAAGIVQLDACVMDGRTLSCGGVAGLEGIRHPAAVALRVMRKTPHVLLVGEGARRFALTEGFREENLLTPAALDEWLARSGDAPAPADKPRERTTRTAAPGIPGGADNHDTVTVLCRAPYGRLGGACSTSGLAHKLPGRVGDSPIIGAGLYVDDLAGAAGCTGVGEEAVRIAAAATMVEWMRNGRSPREAVESAARRVCEVALRRGVTPARIAFLALSPAGEVGAAATPGTGFDYAVARPEGVTLHRAVEVGPG